MAETTIESTSQQASVLKLFEHERRLSVVEKDVERQVEAIGTLTREVYSLPATLRDLMDTRIGVVRNDAEAKFSALTTQLAQFQRWLIGGLGTVLGGIILDIVVRFLPH